MGLVEEEFRPAVALLLREERLLSERAQDMAGRTNARLSLRDNVRDRRCDDLLVDVLQPLHQETGESHYDALDALMRSDPQSYTPQNRATAARNVTLSDVKERVGPVVDRQ